MCVRVCVCVCVCVCVRVRVRVLSLCCCLRLFCADLVHVLPRSVLCVGRLAADLMKPIMEAFEKVKDRYNMLTSTVLSIIEFVATVKLPVCVYMCVRACTCVCVCVLCTHCCLDWLWRVPVCSEICRRCETTSSRTSAPRSCRLTSTRAAASLCKSQCMSHPD